MSKQKCRRRGRIERQTFPGLMTCYQMGGCDVRIVIDVENGNRCGKSDCPFNQAMKPEPVAQSAVA